MLESWKCKYKWAEIIFRKLGTIVVEQKFLLRSGSQSDEFDATFFSGQVALELTDSTVFKNESKKIK